MTNSGDPDQLASSEANWSGSTLFDNTGHVVFSKRRVKAKLFYKYQKVVLQVSVFFNKIRLLYIENKYSPWELILSF